MKVSGLAIGLTLLRRQPGELGPIAPGGNRLFAFSGVNFFWRVLGLL
jgi:hypothetical protein